MRGSHGRKSKPGKWKSIPSAEKSKSGHQNKHGGGGEGGGGGRTIDAQVRKAVVRELHAVTKQQKEKSLVKII